MWTLDIVPPRSLTVLVALALLAGCAGDPEPAPAAPPAPQEPGRVIARVDGVELTVEDLDRVMDADRLLWLAEGAPVSAMADSGDLRQRSFELLVAGELMRQAALEQGIEVSPDEIEDQLAAARSQLPDEQAFREHLAQAGLTEEALREEARRRLLIQRYARSITDDLALDEAEARSVWERRPERFMTDEQVRVAWLLVPVAPGAGDAGREAARRRAEEAARRARAGTPLGELAAEPAQGEQAARVGETGYLTRGRMHPDFDRVVFATPAGELTPVFETPSGFNLVRVLDRREPRQRPFEEVATSLLMVIARERRDERLRQEAERLRGAATIEVLDAQLAPVAAGASR